MPRPSSPGLKEPTLKPSPVHVCRPMYRWIGSDRPRLRINATSSIETSYFRLILRWPRLAMSIWRVPSAFGVNSRRLLRSKPLVLSAVPTFRLPLRPRAPRRRGFFRLSVSPQLTLPRRSSSLHGPLPWTLSTQAEPLPPLRISSEALQGHGSTSLQGHCSEFNVNFKWTIAPYE